jgi:quinol monooxygenase YgiN
VSAQLGLPNWVRARGMSMYQMSIMGASAAGAALWGQIATWTSVPVSLLVAAAVGLVAVLAANRWLGNTYAEEDQTPATTLAQPVVASPPPSGQVLVNIEYHVDPKRADEFRALMQQSRSSRLRHGVLSWELLRDIHEPGRFVEQFVDPSWNEHLRRFQRLTAADAALRDRRNAFHLGDTPPRVTRCVVESTIRE